MRIDETHKSWGVASLAILGVSALVYGFARVPASQRPMGGTATGLAFGVAGFAFMIFAALLGARKKVPVWRIGRAQTWMRGHLWLGLLSLPLILFHAGFQFGGGLTTALMLLLILVVVSGVFGAALQHYMPRVMTREVSMETIYEEIGHVRAQLQEEAEQVMARASAGAAMTAAVGGTSGSAEPEAMSEEASAALRNFYESEVKRFLGAPSARGHALAAEEAARAEFAQLRTLMPAPLHATLDDLENICEEARQLTRQERMHRWLHGWLLLHIPLSLALILLGAVHAVMALRY